MRLIRTANNCDNIVYINVDEISKIQCCDNGTIFVVTTDHSVTTIKGECAKGFIATLKELITSNKDDVLAYAFAE